METIIQTRYALATRPIEDVHWLFRCSLSLTPTGMYNFSLQCHPLSEFPYDSYHTETQDDGAV